MRTAASLGPNGAGTNGHRSNPVAVTAGLSRLMAPPRDAKLTGTTLSLSGIAAREGRWLRMYALLAAYFVALVALAASSQWLLTRLR